MNVERLMEDGYVSSPASTPDTSFDEENFLVRHFREKVIQKHKWYDCRNIPFAIVTVSIFQGRLRVLALYVLGGITGVLGAACIHPDLVIGASAGGYSLLLSNVANIILNYETIEYKIYRAISIATLVLFDIIYDIVHVCSKKEPQISWQAHFVGGLTGLFLGVVIFKCHKVKSTRIRKIQFSVGLFLYCLLVISFIGLTLQIGK